MVRTINICDRCKIECSEHDVIKFYIIDVKVRESAGCDDGKMPVHKHVCESCKDIIINRMGE